MNDVHSFFPLFIDINGKKVLIIGAGKVAYRKAVTLLKYGADITVITKQIKEEKFNNLKNIRIITEEFSEKYFYGHSSYR